MMRNLSELTRGPSVIALRGSDEALPDNELLLGTRELHWHSHRRGQALCIDSGVAHVRTQHVSWLLQPCEIGWIPPGESHWVSLRGVRSGWSLLISPQASRHLPTQPGPLAVTELMPPLVQRAVAWARTEKLSLRQKRVLAVLLDEMRCAPRYPPQLSMPRDRRVLAIADGFLREPARHRTLAAWSRATGVSTRTARRRFLRETGLSFARWRQQARLSLALERLARGEPVAAVAEALGYATPSNFIAMFRRRFGESPGRYAAKRLRL